MLPALRLGFIVCLCLAIGFAAGWRMQSGNHLAPPKVSVEQPSAFTALSPVNPEPLPSVNPRQVSPVARPTSDPLLVRLQSLAWLEQNGLPVRIRVFLGDKLDPVFVRVFGLSPAESDELNAAAQAIKQRLDETAIRSATAQIDADGTMLTVNVPSLPAEGGALYTELVGTFTSTLGPERYPLFNALAGDSLESSFSRFGLNPTKYEINLRPTELGGLQLYNYKQSSPNADGGGSSWSSGVVQRQDVAKNYPVLAHFLPDDFKKPTGK